jgi:aerotolerance regulator-like protein/VWA domain-containing protein
VFGLSFLSPLFLAGVAAAAIPIAIHLFYRRAEPVIDFSAMRFLRRAPVEHAHRRRLRELLLLALRAAALVLLALAFARPYLGQSAAALAAPATIVLVDTSVSMSAPGQFDRARAKATEVIRAATPGSSVGLMTFADGTDVVAPLSDDRAGALTAVGSLRLGAGATRYRTALARAADEIGDRPGRIVLVTDLQQSGWDAADQGALPDRVAVEVEDIGGPAGNLAVTALRVEGTDAFAVVQNFSDHQALEKVTFAVDGRTVGVVPVTMASGGSAEAQLTLTTASAGALTASVSDQEGYVADNIRYALLDASAAPLVLAVTASGHPSESFYLERALTIAQGAGGFRFRAVSGPAFSGLDASELSDVQVVAVLGTRGLEQHGRELLASYVRRGGGVLLTAGPDVDDAIVRQALQDVMHTVWQSRPSTSPGTTSSAPFGAGAPLHFAPDDSRHPVFRIFGGVGTLSNVTFTQSARLDAGPSAVIVARYSDGTPALVEEASGEGRVLMFASDLNNRWNDFPLQPAFVPFVHEALKHLASARQAPIEYVVGQLPGRLGQSPGVVVLPSRRVAINVDPRESDPARMSVDAFTSGISQLAARGARQGSVAAQQREDGQRLWQYALLLMMVSLAAEGMLGRRLG